jgi:hypothetical protein
MLHIINGDSTADTLKQSAIGGDKYSVGDVLVCGPTPSGLNEAEWSALRSKHLSDFYGVELASAEQRLREQDEVLKALGSHDEVVLWFEHDLFCQINLLYLLHRLAASDGRFSLINIGTFPGKPNFRGLGELNVDELSSLFPVREQLTKDVLELGAAAWDAYCSSDPTAIEALLRKDTSAIPFLATALKAHLQRFPSTRNGLGKVENRGLDLIEAGLHTFDQLFPKFVNEEKVYGFGDSQFWLSLKPLAGVASPLLSVDTTGSLELDEIQNVDLEITDVGRAVLHNEADHIELNGIDSWLGGVQLSGRSQIWRWDAATRKLELR